MASPASRLACEVPTHRRRQLIKNFKGQQHLFDAYRSPYVVTNLLADGTDEEVVDHACQRSGIRVARGQGERVPVRRPPKTTTVRIELAAREHLSGISVVQPVRDVAGWFRARRFAVEAHPLTSIKQCPY